MSSQQDLLEDHVKGGVKFEQRVRTSVALEELASRQAKHRKRPLKDQPRHLLPISKSHPNLECMMDVMTKATENTAEIVASEEQPYRSHSGSSVDLTNLLHETDSAVVGVKDPCDPSVGNPSLPQAPTSLPHIPVTSTDTPALEGAGDDAERFVHLIDSQISVEDISFVGRPRAWVVAPEINTNGRREYVVFKIRVADQTGEWTVTRRYRNFEALHKFLRDVPAYRELQPRLPPKTFVFQTHKTEVVEQRRIALDKYLQTILSSDVLAFNRHVWLFLSDQECKSFTPDVRVGLMHTIANNVDNARYRIKRKVADSFKESVSLPTPCFTHICMVGWFLDSSSKADPKKENALRLLDGSESSSISGSIKIEDESDTTTTIPSVKSRPQNGDRPSPFLTESPMRHNASLPEGLSAMALADGRRSPKGGHKRTHKTARFSTLDTFNGLPSREGLPGDLTNANMLSRFEFQDRDAIGRQVEQNAAMASSSAGDEDLFSHRPVHK